jgi:predicted permease
VFLIASANVAVLWLLRASRRRHEMAVRRALGATVPRIARAVAAEALLVGGVATALGVSVAHLVMSMLAPALERQLGRAVPGGVDAAAVGPMTIAAAVAGGLLAVTICSLLLVWVSTRTPVALALTAGPRTGTDGPAQRRTRAALIAIEVAASLALLVGAALTVQSGVRILNVNMGLDVRDVQVARLSLRPRTYTDTASRNEFYTRIHDRMSRISGVQAVAFTTWWPLQATPPRDVGPDAHGAAPAARAGFSGVTPDYFRTVGIDLRDGRAFTNDDRPGAPGVAIVSETLARVLWPAARAVGQRIRVSPPSGSSAPPSSLLIVGVVNDARHAHTDEDLLDVYYAFAQEPAASVFAYVKSGGPQPGLERELRSAITAVDSELPLGPPRPLADILDQQRGGSRFLASVLVVFAASAATLALIGIAGVIAYAVRQREREIAVRMAIGADRRAIARMFIKEGGAIVGCGLVAGIAAALALGRVLQAQLFGVDAADPVVLSLAVVMFGLCGLAAVGWPARMAASTDPAAALKEW